MLLFPTVFFICFFSPPLFYYFGASSFALGVAIAAAFPLCSQLICDVRSHQATLRLGWLFRWGGLFFGFLLAHLALASLGHPISWTRSIASMGLLLLLFMSAAILSSWLSRAPGLVIYKTIFGIFATLVLIVPWSLAGAQPSTIRPLTRPIFPFTEPSHWALSTIPVLLFLCVVSRGWHRAAFLMITMALPILVQNLTLLAGGLLILALSTPLRYAVPMISIELYATVLRNIKLTTFYLDRLGGVVASETTVNLSALVYKQGWETMGHTLSATKGWGIGFQQLGLQPISIESTMAIQKVIPNGLNLMDGGFVMAKLVSELGFFGAFLAVAYVLGGAWAAWSLRKVALGLLAIPTASVLAMSFICGYSLEFFIRGVGYFSGNCVFFAMSCAYLATSVIRNSSMPDLVKRLCPSLGVKRGVSTECHVGEIRNLR